MAEKFGGMRVKNLTYFAGMFFACACALAMPACDSKKEPVEAQQEYISFSSEAVAPESRAIILDDASLQVACSSGDGIGVWGVVNNDNNDNQILINNSKLTYDGQWSYTPVRRWIRGAFHEFWAIYPHSESDLVLDPEAGTLTRNNITLGTTTPANNVDYMCAYNSRDLASPDATTAPVPLAMKHALSMVEFKFINAMGEISGVTDISLEGLRHKGAIVFGKDGSLGGVVDGAVDIRVDVAADKVAAGSGLFNGLCTASPMPKNLSLVYNLYENVGGVIVMPQSLLGEGVKINMTIGATPTTLDLGLFSPTEWEAGKKYVYTFTLTSTTIVCDVRVVDWVKNDVDLVPIE